MQPGQQAQQARLAGAVRADDGHQPARRQTKGEVGEESAPAAAAGELLGDEASQRGKGEGRHSLNRRQSCLELFQSLVSAYEIHYIRTSPARQALLLAGAFTKVARSGAVVCLQEAAQTGD